MQLCENYDFTTTAETSDNDQDEDPKQKNSRRPRNQLESSGMMQLFFIPYFSYWLYMST